MAYLTALGVPFEVRDVSHNPEYLQEMLELTRGLRGTPVIRAGDRYVRGFDPRKLAALLGKA
jgi:glutaredoxin